MSMAADASPLGFSHFILQADLINQSLLIVLLSMSIISWSIILTKTFSYWRMQRRSKHFLKQFGSAIDIQNINVQPICNPFSSLTQQALFAHNHLPTQPDSESESLMVSCLRRHLDEQITHFENGLTFLATIAATAPFVGLFGTVWGIYHALLAISLSGAGTIDKVAGPVGEALIMTGIGLVVAIPAVMAYNAFSRKNHTLMIRLESFAFELATLARTGRVLGSQPVSTSKNALSA